MLSVVETPFDYAQGDNHGRQVERRAVTLSGVEGLSVVET